MKFSVIMKGRIYDMLKTSLASLRDIFFTRECVVCGRVLVFDEQHLCRDCLDDMPLTYFWGRRDNPAMERLAGRCRLQDAASLFFYRQEGGYAGCVRQFKYKSDLELGAYMSQLLGGYLASGAWFRGVQIVVPVPLHPLKRLKRGFNQSEVIAEKVAGCLAGCRVEKHLLRRRRYTSTQTRKGIDERKSNVSGAFALNRRVASRLIAEGVRSILIVDDVLTTGSTLAACIRLIEGDFEVRAATLGFVE